jgi:hypothetical protein
VKSERREPRIYTEYTDAGTRRGSPDPAVSPEPKVSRDKGDLRYPMRGQEARAQLWPIIDCIALTHTRKEVPLRAKAAHGRSLYILQNVINYQGRFVDIFGDNS